MFFEFIFWCYKLQNNVNASISQLKVYVVILVAIQGFVRFYNSFLILQLPGVSYRGRIMVEIDVNIGNLPTERHEDIKLVEQKKLTVSGRVEVNVQLH